MSPPSRPPIRIAILECDTPIGKTKERYGGYGNLFHELLLKGVDELAKEDGQEGEKEAKLELAVTKFDVVNDLEAYPKLEDVDAVLLTGSSMFITISPQLSQGGSSRRKSDY